MRRVMVDGLGFLEFERLGEERRLRHGFALRYAGAREGADGESAEGCGGVGEQGGLGAPSDGDHCRALGLPAEKCVKALQVHEDTVAVIDRLGQRAPAADGLCTNVGGVPLMLVSADCPLVLVYDPETPAVGLAHAGWRGTVRQITGKLVATMVERFGSEAGKLQAGIAPAICGRCYQVGPEVVEAARERLNQPERFITAVSCEPGGGQKERWLFDLPLANRLQLMEAGVLPENIESSPWCTFEQKQWFYSYRREGVQAGRCKLIAALAG